MAWVLLRTMPHAPSSGMKVIQACPENQDFVCSSYTF